MWLHHLAFLGPLCPALVTAQERIVRGVVIDSVGRGVPFAVVTETATESSVQTDENGRFRLQLEQSSGKCAVWVRRLGFHSATLNLETCPDSALRIELARAPRDESGPRCGTRSTSPCVAPGVPGFFAISAGQTHSCALERDGTAWCWGDGRKGALGDGTTTVQQWPRRVDTEQRFRQIATGGNATCGVIAGGSVFCWGANGHGQLGHVGVAVRSPQRVTVKGAERFRKVESGGIETCAIATTNALYCWGADYRSTRLTGLSNDEVQPRHVANGIRAVAMGQVHFCAVSTDAVVRCWGDTIMGAFAVR
jgi:hypothetical protein